MTCAACIEIGLGGWSTREHTCGAPPLVAEIPAKPTLLSALTAIGSAHAGEALTPEALLERLRDPEFRRRFNGPPPAKVTFPDEATARLASDFENAGRRQR